MTPFCSFEPDKYSSFGVLSERSIANNSYFATGAGGMLQTVLFGFGGLYFTDQEIIQKNPILPKEWKSLIITGVGINMKTFVVKGNEKLKK